MGLRAWLRRDKPEEVAAEFATLAPSFGVYRRTRATGVDACPLGGDPSGPLHAKVGDRVLWRGEEFVVVLRTDILDGVDRHVELLVEGSRGDIDLGLIDSPDGPRARSWRQLDWTALTPEEALSEELTTEGVNCGLKRSAVVSVRTVGDEGYIVEDDVEWRCFEGDGRQIRCERFVAIETWEWRTTGIDDVDFLTIAVHEPGPGSGVVGGTVDRQASPTDVVAHSFLDQLAPGL